MDLHFIHFYPDLMNLYGSYANAAVLKRYLEQQGHRVHVTAVAPGQDADLTDADFLFMGAGTERRQQAAGADFLRFAPAVQDLAQAGVTMLFAGTAMELLGTSVTNGDTTFPGIGLAAFTTQQGPRRLVGDVYGHTDLFEEAVVGFMNKCGVVSGVETPLLTALDMGFGNDAQGGPEGFHWKNVFASQLTGPILVKNPRLLETVAAAICAHRGAPSPTQPVSAYASAGYAITEEQLRLRCQKPAQ